MKTSSTHIKSIFWLSRFVVQCANSNSKQEAARSSRATLLVIANIVGVIADSSAATSQIMGLWRLTANGKN
jgi:uncharacterized membrane protein